MAGHAPVNGKESVRPDPENIEIESDRKERKSNIDREEEQIDREEEEETVAARFRRLEDQPTKEEIEEHNIDHAKFRAWCPHCVRGKAKSYPHRQDKKKGVR